MYFWIALVVSWGSLWTQFVKTFFLSLLQPKGVFLQSAHNLVVCAYILSYQKWKGTDYVPPLTHPALKWSVKDPLPLPSVVTDAPWQIIDKKNKKEVETETTNI